MSWLSTVNGVPVWNSTCWPLLIVVGPPTADEYVVRAVKQANVLGGRALREAIRNALVHSGTARLDVTVEISESRLHARVFDTGRGFSVEEATKAGEGIGLSSMRERAQLLGGALRLSSRLGHGTTVDISIPLGRVLL